MWHFGARPKNETRARDKPGAKSLAVSTGELKMVRRTRADMTMRNNEAIYAAVSRIANTVASMPLHLYKGYELQRDHPLERLVGLCPNVNFTAFGFKQTMEAFRNMEGNAYALIVPGVAGGAPHHLDILDPASVVPRRHPTTHEMWYVVTLDDGKQYPLPGCQLIVLRHMSANGEIGIRPIDVLRGSLDYSQSVKELSLQQLEGVNHGVFLKVPGSAMDPDNYSGVVDDFLKAYEESGHKVVVLEGGLEATTFSQSAIDAQVLDVERITRNRVATVYNIPPHMLGDYTDTSFATAEQQMSEFLQMTIIPIVVQWEEELNRKLLSEADYRDGYRFRFDTDSLIRADAVAMANTNQMAIRGGWRRPNEVREREGRPPDPNGDMLMSSRDLIPLEIAVQHPELLLSSGGGSTSTAEGGASK